MCFDDSLPNFPLQLLSEPPNFISLFFFLYRPQSPMAGKVIHSRGKLATAILLNEHIIQLPSFTLIPRD